MHFILWLGGNYTYYLLTPQRPVALSIELYQGLDMFLKLVLSCIWQHANISTYDQISLYGGNYNGWSSKMLPTINFT